MRRGFFIVRYDPVDPFLAEITARTANAELARISSALGFTPDKGRPFVLEVYGTHHDFTKAGRHNSSPMVVGTARSYPETISVDASGSVELPETVIAHEITHAVVFRILGQRIGALPAWMHEGLAVHLSQDIADSDETMVAEAAAEGLLPPLPTSADRFRGEGAGLAYAQSGVAVRHMVEQYGSSAPRRLLEALAGGASCDEAMLKVAGVDQAGFADQWMAGISRRYATLRYARIAAGIGSAAMAALAVVAFLRRRRQKIEQARRWELEDGFREDDY